MASHLLPRSAQAQTLCTFLYPSSCFRSPAVRKSLAISIAPLRTNCNRHTPPRELLQAERKSSYRQFSTTTRKQAARDEYQRLRGDATAGVSGVVGSKSFKVAAKEAMQKEMPEDIGLFENTLIIPTGKSKPGLFSHPRLRAALEWHRLKLRVVDFSRLLIYKFTQGKPRPKISRRKLPSIAAALHQSMYEAFAAGSMNTIKTLCTEGLQQQFSRRIAARPRNTRLKWKVVRQFGRPRVVSDKAVIFPAAGRQIGQRQVVFKIDTLQSLTTHTVTRQGDVVDEKTSEDRNVEYLVLQTRFESGVQTPWKVWGTTDEKEWRKILSRAGYEHLVATADMGKAADKKDELLSL